MKKYIGIVKTDIVGSECQFDLDEDFADLTEEEQGKSLMACLWGSGMIEVYSEEIE